MSWQSISQRVAAKLAGPLGMLAVSVVNGQEPAPPTIAPAPQIQVPSVDELPLPSPVVVAAPAQQRPSLGIVAEEQAGDAKGLLVLSVRENSPAKSAGVRVGDVLTGLNGKSTNSIEDVSGALNSMKAGDVVTVEILRGDQLFEMKANLVNVPPPSVSDVGPDPLTPEPAVPALPSSEGLPNAPGQLGLTVEDAGSSGTVPAQRGAKVVSVVPGSPADKAGVQPGNIIVSIDGRVMYGARELISYMAQTRPGQSIELGYYRNRLLVRSSITLGGSGAVAVESLDDQPASSRRRTIIGGGNVGQILEGVGRTIDNLLGARRGGDVPNPGAIEVPVSPNIPQPDVPNALPRSTVNPTESAGDTAEVAELQRQIQALLQRVQSLEQQLSKANQGAQKESL